MIGCELLFLFKLYHSFLINDCFFLFKLDLVEF